MNIQTKAFGEIAINEEDILTFVSPILGFEDIDKYVVLADQSKSGPFMWLQSTENHEPAFVVAEPSSIWPNYQPKFSQEDLAELELEQDADQRILLIVRIPENIKNISANLKAPVVINAKKSLAKQIVLNDEKYPVRQYLISGDAGGEAHAGAKPQSK